MTTEQEGNAAAPPPEGSAPAELVVTPATGETPPATESESEADAPPKMGSILDGLEDGDSDEAPAESEDQADGDDAETTDLEGLKLSEDALLGEQHLEALKSVASEHGLTLSQAQAFLDWHQELAAAQQDAWSRQAVEQNTKWNEELRRDPAFGGANLKANQGLYNKALHAVFPASKYGDLHEKLKESGYISWPPFVKALSEFARDQLSEPSVTVKGEIPESLSADERARKTFSNSPEMFEQAGAGRL